MRSARDIETRATPSPPELRGGSGSRKVGGLAIVFNKPSHPLGGFVELVEPRAVRKSESEGFPGVLAKFEHRDLLGSIASGTLQLRVTPDGVDYTLQCPNTTAGNDVLELTGAGILTGSSWAFQTYDCDWQVENGVTVRHLTDVRIIDVSCVAQPAYPQSTLTVRDWRDYDVALRSLAVQYSADPEDVYQMARDNQLSRLFVNTSRSYPGLGRHKRPTISGRDALLATMAMAHPEASLKRSQCRRLHELELMSMVVDPATGKAYGTPPTPRQEAVEKMRVKTSKEKILETLALDPDWQ